MKHSMALILAGLTAFGSVSLTASPLSIHLMQVQQIIGGVDGDTSAQAIQLRMRALGQNFAQFSRIRVWNAAGTNPVVIVSPATMVANNQAGDHILIASAAFSNATSPAAAPDFVMTNLIPASYLAAGSLTFENTTGSTVWWRVSWGGASYTGSVAGSIINDVDGNFGPPFASALPSGTTQSVLFQGAAGAMSTTNAADYAISAGDAVFTNNAGTAFTVQSQATAAGDTPGPAQLHQNVPNPFNPSTAISFTLRRRGSARLAVYDGGGRLITTLIDGSADAGLNTVTWDGRDDRGRRVGSGVYFYRLDADGVTETRKMTLLK